MKNTNTTTKKRGQFSYVPKKTAASRERRSTRSDWRWAAVVAEGWIARGKYRLSRFESLSDMLFIDSVLRDGRCDVEVAPSSSCGMMYYYMMMMKINFLFFFKSEIISPNYEEDELL